MWWPPSHVDRALFALPLLLALTITGLLSKFQVPHQLIAIGMGGIIGAMVVYVPKLDYAITFCWIPEHILFATHPIMILKLTYGMDRYLLLNSMPQILVICLIGVFSFILAFGVLLNLMMPESRLTFTNTVMGGITLAAIDVPDILLELHQIKNLQMLMDTESILGTAFCLCTYDLCLGAYMGIITHWYQVVCVIIRIIGIAPFIGIIAGKITVYLILQIFDDSLNLTTTIFGATYFIYIACERFLSCNGCIATFVADLEISQGMSKLSYDVNKSVQRFIDSVYDAIELLNSIVLSAQLHYHMLKVYQGFYIAIAFGVYIVGNVVRFIVFFMLSPILSRIGYGFEFTTMFTVSWGSKRGSLQLLQVICLLYDKVLDILGPELLCFTLVYLTLTLLINMTTIKSILRKFGLLELSQSRKNNIIYCIKIVRQKTARILTNLKMNRFYTDANWLVVNEAMKLSNPFDANDDEGTTQILDSGYKEMYCPSCKAQVYVPPSKAETEMISRDAKMRVLKVERVSYMKQFEDGLIEKEDLKLLLQAVETAINSEEIEVDVEHFLAIFRKKTVLIKLRNLMKGITPQSTGMVPLLKYKRRAYRIATSEIFQIFIYLVIIVDVINSLTLLIYSANNKSMLAFDIINGFCCLAYISEFIIHIIAYSEKPYLRFLRKYLKNAWRCLELVITVISVVAVFQIIAAICGATLLTEQVYMTMEAITMVRILNLLKIVINLEPKISKAMDKKIDERKLSNFTVGKALMVGFDDVLDSLPEILVNEGIREALHERVLNSKIIMGTEVGMMEKESPGIMTTIKTRQAIKATLVTMERGIAELKYSGFVDEYEHQKLCTSLQENWKHVGARIEKPILPKQIFFEIPWLMYEDTIAQFLYDNIINKVWEAGEYLCVPGEVIEGIYILISGLFKIVYKPSVDMLYTLKEIGELPVKDVLNARLKDTQVDFVMVGNTIGELGILTGRPSSCTIMVELPSQAFIIPCDIMDEAVQMSRDPINGLEARLWKYVTTQLVQKILSETSIYASVTNDHMDAILDRGIIPDLSSYKVLQINEYVEDVVLLEGLIIDLVTREVFSAMSYIPRSVTKMIFPGTSHTTIATSIKTKLFIIPLKGIDGYTVMYTLQGLSELIPNAPSQTLITEATVLRTKHNAMKLNTRAKSLSKGVRSTSSSAGGSKRSIV